MLDRYDENLILGYVEDELSPSEQAAFEQLLADDAQLRALVQNLIEDRAQLRQVPAVEAPVSILADVTASLERDMLLGQSAPSDSYKFPAWTRRAKWAGSIAAMVLLAIGLTYQFDPFGWKNDADKNNNGMGTFAVVPPVEKQFDKNGDTIAHNSLAQNDKQSVDNFRGNKNALAADASTNRTQQRDQFANAQQAGTRFADAVDRANQFVSIELAAADLPSTRETLKALAAENDAIFISTQDQLAMRGRDAAFGHAAGINDANIAVPKATANEHALAAQGHARDDADRADRAEAHRQANATAGAPTPKAAPLEASTTKPTNTAGDEKVARAKKSGEGNQSAKGGAANSAAKSADTNHAAQANAGAPAPTPAPATAPAPANPTTTRPAVANAVVGKKESKDGKRNSAATADPVADTAADTAADPAAEGGPSADDQSKRDQDDKATDKKVPSKDQSKSDVNDNDRNRVSPPRALAKELEEADAANNGNGKLMQGQPKATLEMNAPNALSFAVPADRVQGLISQLEERFGRDQIVVQTADAREIHRSMSKSKSEAQAGKSNAYAPGISTTRPGVAPPAPPTPRPEANADVVANPKRDALKQHNARTSDDAGEQKTTDEEATRSNTHAAGNLPADANDDAAINKDTNNLKPRSPGQVNPSASKRAAKQVDAGHVEESASKRHVIISIILQAKATPANTPDHPEAIEKSKDADKSADPAASTEPSPPKN